MKPNIKQSSVFSTVVIMICIFLIIVTSGCINNNQTPIYIPPPPQNSSEAAGSISGMASLIVDSINTKTAAEKIAQLPTVDIDTVENFENYKKFADNMNDIIKILREQTHFDDIPMLEKKQEDFSKFSKVIEEWSPLIGNYNELVLSARNFDEKNEISIQNFYTKSATFAFETTIIYVAAFYGPSYKTVGTVYRRSGMQSFAFTCGSCVSVVLSHAHWFVRAVLVETSSKTFEAVVDCMQENDLSVENLENITSCFINKIPPIDVNVENIVNDVSTLTNKAIDAIGNFTSSLGIKLP